jgi:plastocyanin
VSRIKRRALLIGALACLTAFVATGISLASSTLQLKASTSALKFSTRTLHAGHGRVTIRMTNPSSLKHGIAVEGHGVDKDGRIVGKGGVSTVTVTLKKGRYEFYCPIKAHKAAGMKGTLIVS